MRWHWVTMTPKKQMIKWTQICSGTSKKSAPNKIGDKINELALKSMNCIIKSWLMFCIQKFGHWFNSSFNWFCLSLWWWWCSSTKMAAKYGINHRHRRRHQPKYAFSFDLLENRDQYSWANMEHIKCKCESKSWMRLLLTV